jgi:hypothetical protein
VSVYECRIRKYVLMCMCMCVCVCVCVTRVCMCVCVCSFYCELGPTWPKNIGPITNTTVLIVVIMTCRAGPAEICVCEGVLCMRESVCVCVCDVYECECLSACVWCNSVCV